VVRVSLTTQLEHMVIGFMICTTKDAMNL
jgi:hypothetical protein